MFVGYVREYRSIIDWRWYKHVPTAHLFRHLILMAQWKPCSFGGADLQRGQLLTGRKTLAIQTGLTEQQVKTALINLQRSHEITINSTNKYSVITICNYNNYQGEDEPSSTSNNTNEQPATTPTSNQQTTSKQPANNHMQEDKNSRIQEFKKKNSSFPADADASPAQMAIEVLKAKKPKTEKAEAKGTATWMAYSEAYEQRYGVPPVRNQRSNIACCQLVDRLGADEAPNVASWYLSSRNALYSQSGHSLPLLVRDAEKLRTEWASGRRMTNTAAREEDRMETVGQAWRGAIESLKEKGIITE